ncbi:MAG TPA: class I SAM-dependent methyltransferase [Methylophilaceae bacterium]|jgi:methylase of polypeptide subunit release factors
MTANWHSESGAKPPQRVIVADDTIKADAAYRLVCEGTAILWRGDFQNARQLLQAISRRMDNRGHPAQKAKVKEVQHTPTEAFHLHRQAQSQRARTLGMLLLPFNADHVIPLRRAPDVAQACSESIGKTNQPYVASMRELLGLIGAYEWRKKGVEIPALEDRIHPHYGVFSPVRGEYVELVANTPLPALDLAFDIGTGTGVLAAVLAKRGVKRIIATDQDTRALACANDNIARLGLKKQVEVIQADLFPPGKAPLIVCNPPWIPARPSSPLEAAVYDHESAMLRGFLSGLAAHLTEKGEGWLILSDLAEHLGLRSREELLAWIEASGLKVLEHIDVKPHHPKSKDDTDPLHAARKAEVTSLWRLAVQ